MPFSSVKDLGYLGAAAIGVLDQDPPQAPPERFRVHEGRAWSNGT